MMLILGFPVLEMLETEGQTPDLEIREFAVDLASI